MMVDLLADGGVDLTSPTIGITSKPLADFCAGPGQADGPIDVLALFAGLADGGVVTAATYFVPDGGSGPNEVSALRVGYDDAGVTTTFLFSSGGTMTLSSIDATGATGTFDIAFTRLDGGVATVSGTFNAPTLVCMSGGGGGE